MDGGAKIWCTDCHGDLNQRIAQNQMAQPWSVATLPKCSKCHTSTPIGENPTLGVFSGTYLNSMTHGGPEEIAKNAMSTSGLRRPLGQLLTHRVAHRLSIAALSAVL